MEYYYVQDLTAENILLSPEESQHCTKVKRHKVGDTIAVTDGQGCLAKAVIISIDKQHCALNVTDREYGIGQRDFTFHLAIAPTKNRDRIEWLMEKCVEIGIEKITLITTARSERSRVDLSRLERIAISAMKQSQTTYLPEIQSCSFEELISNTKDEQGERYIAWCETGVESKELAACPLSSSNIILMIGPEGDFSQEEVITAQAAGFQEVRLGPKRLRTETAGLYGCCVVAGSKVKG